MAINPIQLLLTARSTLGPQLAEAAGQVRALGGAVVATQGQITAMTVAMDMASMAGPLAAITAITAAVGTAGSVIFGTKDRLMELADEAERLTNVAARSGGSASAIMGLSKQLDDMGIPVENLQTSLKFLQAAIANQDAALAKHGITARDSIGALMQLADVFEKMPAGPERTAVALELLGSRGGQAIIPFLEQGSAGILAMSEDLRSMGVVLDDLTLNRLAKFDDANDRLKRRWEGLSNTLAVMLLPAMERFVWLSEQLMKHWGTLATLFGGPVVGLARTLASLMMGPAGGGAGVMGPTWLGPTSTQPKSPTAPTVPTDIPPGYYGPFPVYGPQRSDFDVEKDARELADAMQVLSDKLQASRNMAHFISQDFFDMMRDVKAGTLDIGKAFMDLVSDILMRIVQQKAEESLTNFLFGLATGGAPAPGLPASGGRTGVPASRQPIVVNVNALSAKDIVRSFSDPTGEMNLAFGNLSLAARLP